MYNTEGYANKFNVTGGPFYQYYRKDHPGNNREVLCANNATILQRTHYYPSGLPWHTNTGVGADVQNRKYNGKEFVEMHGLDEFDYHARGMYPAIMRFTTIDPLAEDYYDVSPYAYVLNNPLRYTDPTGMSAENANDEEDIDGGELKEVTITAKRNDPVGSRAMDPVSGFWGWIDYLAFGRTYNSGQNTNGNYPVLKATWIVNSDGIITGVQPLTGTIDVSIVGKVGTFLKLRSLAKEKKLEVHHLAEVRHLRRLLKSTGKGPAVVLTKAEHQTWTKELREALPYGKRYSKAEIIEKYTEVYKSHPEWLKAVIEYLQ